MSFAGGGSTIDLSSDAISTVGSGPRNLPGTATEEQKGTSFLHMVIKTSRKVELMPHASSIKGCFFMPEGDLVLCDYKNSSVIHLSESFALNGSLDLRARPWDATAVNKITAIVTIPFSKQLQYLMLRPKLNSGHLIQLDKPCWGVDVADGNIFVTCHNHGIFTLDGEIRVLDMDGNLRRTLGINQTTGAFLMKRPYYISVSRSTNKIIVSDTNGIAFGIIFCFEPDGTTDFSYKDSALAWPRGQCFDGQDNVLVCNSYFFENVQILTADGEREKTLLTSSHGITSPYSVAYRHTDDTMVVGCKNCNTLFVFEMEHKEQSQNDI